MIINDNLGALNTLNQLTKNNNAVQKSLQQLSSGLRINSAADDPAGLAISQKMQGQINGLNKASSNAQDANSLIQTADGSLSETQSILQNMRELAVQAGNDTNMASDRQQLQQEINQYTSEINGISNTTQFNTQNLLDGSQDASTAVTGVENFKLNGTLNVGDTVQIGNQTFTAVASGATIPAGSSGSEFNITATASGTASNLEAAIGNNVVLSSAYAASGAAGTVTLTQKTANTLMAGIAGTGVNANSVQTVAAGVSKGTGKSLVFQIGANQNQSLALNIGNMSALALGIASTASGNGFSIGTENVTNGTNNTNIQFGLDITSASSAASAVTSIQSAIDMVSSQRSVLGAYQNRLNSTVNNLTTSSQNLTSAKAGITDVDMAAEMSNFTKENILSQAATSMLYQANQLPQNVLKLLQ